MNPLIADINPRCNVSTCPQKAHHRNRNPKVKRIPMQTCWKSYIKKAWIFKELCVVAVHFLSLFLGKCQVGLHYPLKLGVLLTFKHTQWRVFLSELLWCLFALVGGKHSNFSKQIWSFQLFPVGHTSVDVVCYCISESNTSCRRVTFSCASPELTGIE